jgi:hypothetical protein
MTRQYLFVIAAIIFAWSVDSSFCLEFRLPKHGRHYDWSEVTFLFEREADEDGYPVLEVDGTVVRRFDFKQMSYELSFMGQQVGRHTATVTLFEYPPGEEPEGGEAANPILGNVSVTYYIATPGTPDLRESLSKPAAEDAAARQRFNDALLAAEEALAGVDAGAGEEDAAEQLEAAEARLREAAEAAGELQTRQACHRHEDALGRSVHTARTGCSAHRSHAPPPLVHFRP